jgi:hypothetical protein
MKTSILKYFSYIAFCAAVACVSFWYGRHTASGSLASSINRLASSDAKKHDTASFLGANGNLDLSALLNAKGKPNAALLEVWAAGLSAKECMTNLEQLKTAPPSAMRDALMAALIGSWAKQDPTGFLAGSGTIASPQMRESGVDAALKALAATDPKAALQWFRDNPGNGSVASQQQRFASIISGFASVDPQGAFETVNSLALNTPADRALKTLALNALTSSLADAGRFTEAVGFLAQLTDNNMRNQALGGLMARWGQDAPQEALAWLATVDDPFIKSTYGPQVAAAWAATDPQAAAAWALKQATDPKNAGDANSQNLLASAIRSWARFDMDGTGEYLNALPASPEKDRAVVTFALSAGQQDPVSAMQWVGTVQDEAVRQRLAMATALQWAQTDQTAFNDFLSTTSLLTDDQKQQVQQTADFAANFGGGPGGPGGFGGSPGGGGPGGDPNGPGGRGGPGGGSVVGAVTQLASGTGSAANTDAVQGQVESMIVNGTGSLIGGGPGGPGGGRGGRGGGGG